MNWTKVSAIAFSTITAATLFATPAFAKSVTTTIVSGVIVNEKGNAVNNANISVVCNGVTKTTQTNKNGTYSVTFGNGKCGVGSNVVVSAEKNNKSSSSSGTVQNEGSVGGVTLDFSLVSFSIPEFGWATGAAAFLGALGVYFGLRKKTSIV